MADHIFKHKITGNEILLPKDFSKQKIAENYDDLGEGQLVMDTNTGINSVKLKKEPKAAEPEKVKPVSDQPAVASNEEPELPEGKQAAVQFPEPITEETSAIANAAKLAAEAKEKTAKK